MLYEMATGQRPFRGASNAAIYDAILHHKPVPIMTSQHEVQWIIDRALEKKPEQRFQTVAELKIALKTLKQDSFSGAHTSVSGALSQPLRPSSGTRWLVKAAVAFSAVLVFALAGYWRWFGTKAIQPSAPRAASFTQLTRAPGQEIYPSLSPDGK